MDLLFAGATGEGLLGGAVFLLSTPVARWFPPPLIAARLSADNKLRKSSAPLQFRPVIWPDINPTL